MFFIINYLQSDSYKLAIGSYQTIIAVDILVALIVLLET